jgi:undecaprenyl-diphosphatase
LSHITYPEAIVVGLLQGVTELFPVSSLGHSVLLPALLGGRWAHDLSVSSPESPYLAFIVGLHVATALALLAYFWRDWVRIIRGLATSVRHRRIDTTDERLAWMIIVATIPVGVTGLLLEHTFRTVLGRPVPAAIFLTVNGAILYGAELLRRRAAAAGPGASVVTRGATPTVIASRSGSVPARTASALGTRTLAVDASTGLDGITGWHGLPQAGGDIAAIDAAAVDAAAVDIAAVDAAAVDAAAGMPGGGAADARIVARGWRHTTLIGAAQILALLPGISRSGATMAAGLARGLSHEDAARFSFLLATPVILAAGVLKLPDLFGPLGHGIGGQVIAGSVASGVGAYLAVRFLTRYFHSRTLTPFAVYCAVAGATSLVWLTVFS